jgi:hypothetical protein
MNKPLKQYVTSFDTELWDVFIEQFDSDVWWQTWEMFPISLMQKDQLLSVLYDDLESRYE